LPYSPNPKFNIRASPELNFEFAAAALFVGTKSRPLPAANYADRRPVPALFAPSFRNVVVRDTKFSG
jgi:hypothetical protein